MFLTCGCEVYAQGKWINNTWSSHVACLSLMFRKHQKGKLYLLKEIGRFYAILLCCAFLYPVLDVLCNVIKMVKSCCVKSKGFKIALKK